MLLSSCRTSASWLRRWEGVAVAVASRAACATILFDEGSTWVIEDRCFCCCAEPLLRTGEDDDDLFAGPPSPNEGVGSFDRPSAALIAADDTLLCCDVVDCMALAPIESLRPIALPGPPLVAAWRGWG